METASSLKIGLFGIGLDTYWPQFEGLKERLEGYLQIVEEKLTAIHPNVINGGLVDNIDKAFETEASGGINLDTITAYAETGVDYVSVGGLIHQAKSLDLSLKAVII